MVGDAAGGRGGGGYWQISVDAKLHLAHRLAWLHFYGEGPRHQIDHINGDKLDNRIANLRDVPHQINQQNRRRVLSTNKSSGLIGAHRHRSRWQSRIRTCGRYVFLGVFDTPEAAHAAYVEAKRRLHPGCTL
jgi:hypothetical protein